MVFKTRNEIHPDYAYICCEGEFDQERIPKLLSKAFDLAKRSGRKAALVDIRELHGPPPTAFDRFFIAELIAKLNLTQGRGIFLAIVGNVPIIDPKRFGETSATNRGALIKVFTKIDNATTWLKFNVENKRK